MSQVDEIAKITDLEKKLIDAQKVIASSYIWMQDQDEVDEVKQANVYMLKGMSHSDIARALKINRNKMEIIERRVLILRNLEIGNLETNQARINSIAQFKTIQAEAWHKLEYIQEDHPNYPKFLNLVMTAEKEIMKLQGTEAAKKQEISVSSDPLQVVFNASIPASQIPEHLRRAVLMARGETVKELPEIIEHNNE